MGGKNIDKICGECQDTPLILGRRWANHCKTVHNRASFKVKYLKNQKPQPAVTPSNGNLAMSLPSSRRAASTKVQTDDSK